MSRLASLLLAAAIAAPTTASASDDGLRLHPIPGRFGPEDSACGASGQIHNLISPVLCDKLAPIERRRYWGQRFDALIADLPKDDEKKAAGGHGGYDDMY